jgi:hypothetical protein
MFSTLCGNAQGLCTYKGEDMKFEIFEYAPAIDALVTQVTGFVDLYTVKTEKNQIDENKATQNEKHLSVHLLPPGHTSKKHSTFFTNPGALDKFCPPIRVKTEN